MKNLQQQQGAAEQLFARRLVVLLNEGLEQIDDSKLDKLAFSRKLALRAQRSLQQRLAALARPAFGLAGRTLAFSGGPTRPGRTGLSVAVIGLVFVCLFGIFQVEQQRRIEELADIDSALLSDELPISAYADHGFNTYLKQNH
jgi:hypothetical protein